MSKHKLVTNEVLLAKAKSVRTDLLQICIAIGKAMDQLEEDPNNEKLKLALHNLIESCKSCMVSNPDTYACILISHLLNTTK